MAKTPRSKIVSQKHLARLEREQIQRRYLLIGTIVILLLVVGVMVYGFLDQRYFQFNRTVATVNGETVKLGELQSRVSFNRIQLIQQYSQTVQLAQLFGQDPANSEYFSGSLQQIQTQLEDETSLGTLSLQQMTDELLIKQQADTMGVSVSEEEVDARIQEFFGFFPNGTPTPAATATEWATPTLSATQLAIVTITPTPTEEPTATPDPAVEAATATATLAAEPTPAQSATPLPTATAYTEAGFQADFKSYMDSLDQYGIKESDLRRIFQAELLRNKMIDKIAVDVKAEEEMVWARHILVADEATALAARERIINGEDFAAVAAELSTDTSNKDTGGDLGWFNRSAMVEPFGEVAFALEIGEISQPVQTDFGFHLIQVLGHEVRPLDSDAFQTARETAFEEWMTGLREAEGAVVTFDNVWAGKLPTEPALDLGA